MWPLLHVGIAFRRGQFLLLLMLLISFLPSSWFNSRLLHPIVLYTPPRELRPLLRARGEINLRGSHIWRIPVTLEARLLPRMERNSQRDGSFIVLGTHFEGQRPGISLLTISEFLPPKISPFLSSSSCLLPSSRLYCIRFPFIAPPRFLLVRFRPSKCEGQQRQGESLWQEKFGFPGCGSHLKISFPLLYSVRVHSTHPFGRVCFTE